MGHAKKVMDKLALHDLLTGDALVKHEEMNRIEEYELITWATPYDADLTKEECVNQLDAENRFGLAVDGFYNCYSEYWESVYQLAFST